MRSSHSCRLLSTKIAALGLAFLTSASSHAVVIGGFNVTRGGAGAIAGGSDLDSLRQSITTAFPGTMFVGAETLTGGFLGGVDVLFLMSVKSGTTAITPLSAAEQQAVRNFINSGGTAVICADNDTFAGATSDPANESLIDPFGLDSVGTGSPWPQATTIPNPRGSDISNGPFGLVTTWSVGWSGWFNGVPPTAAVIGTVNQSGLPGLVVFNRHALAACSGVVVLYSDTTGFVDGFFSLGSPNDVLMRNTIAVVTQPSCTAGQCGDINASGSVDGIDLGLLLANWNTASAAADLTADGTVNGVDLGILLVNWGPCSEK